MSMSGKIIALFIWTVSSAFLFAMPAASQTLPSPEGRVILTISGKITKTNTDGKAEFDLDMLHSLGTRALSVTTSWTDGIQEFSGVPMSDLMKAVGAEGKTVEAIALNDYTYTIEVEDFALYPVILATKLNGNILKVRDKGPLWIIYPLDQFTDLEKTVIERRMVWQLRQLIVK